MHVASYPGSNKLDPGYEASLHAACAGSIKSSTYYLYFSRLGTIGGSVTLAWCGPLGLGPFVDDTASELSRTFLLYDCIIE